MHRAVFKCPFSGAGLVLSKRLSGGPPVVSYVVEGGPSHKKVFEGDELLKVDGIKCPEVRARICMFLPV